MNGNNSAIESKTIAVAGASGTIGGAVVQALMADGHRVLALVRSNDGQAKQIPGATVCEVDLFDGAALGELLSANGAATVISCIASRSGSPKDAEAVDFECNRVLLKAAEGAGVDHFLLLSAICVQRPQLAFQRAKLRFESLLKVSVIDHTIIRPTAFFKSLSGQIDRVLSGKPFLLFGDGELTQCKPISDADLARYIADCVVDGERRGETLAIGGPGPAITPRIQGHLLFEAAGMEPHFRSVPVAMFGVAAGVLSLGARFSDWFAAKAEYARIARYYATQSMLVLDPKTGLYDADATPEVGEDQLIDHYRTLIASRAK